MTSRSLTEKTSFLSCKPEQAVDQTIEFLVIWDTMKLMWCHCYMIGEMYSVIGDFDVKSKWQSGKRFNVMANYISCNFKHWLMYHRMMGQNIACMWGTKSNFVFVYVVMIKFTNDFFSDAFCSVVPYASISVFDGTMACAQWYEQKEYHKTYSKTSNIKCTFFNNLNFSHPILQLSLPNPLKQGFKWRMKK